ncbi:ABC transporter substrate-binding protein [Paracoccus pantotrophus]|nr:ABC transporter substrate-binding protein [Paracoccus pantotrophus]
MMFRIRHLATCIACAVALLSQPASAEIMREVVYYGDRSVSLPPEIDRIATNWEAQNSILTMLGYGDRIVATTRIARSMPLMQKFVPSIKAAALTTLGDGTVNVEELMVLKPDILFSSRALPDAVSRQLRGAGIAVASFRSNSIDALVERVLITGEMLGPDALEVARRYQGYFDDNRRRVAERLEGIPPDRRVRVYLASGAPLSTSGRPSLNQDWMDLGGAINIAESWFGDMPYASGIASLENIIAGNPDVIISMNAEDAEEIRTNPQWRNVKAVREGRVYANPRGLFWWCRETSEGALQFLWLASTLYPDALADIDMREETRRFYRKFYRIELTDNEIAEFLKPTY